MVAHKKTHLEDKIITIGRINRGNYAGSFRPHEHQYNKKTNTCGFGPGATIHEIRYPQGCIVDGQLICRNCKTSMGPISTNTNVMTLRAQALRAAKLNRHIQETCGAKRKFFQ